MDMDTGLLLLRERRQLRDLLLMILGMRDPQTRNQLIEGLPPKISDAIEFSYVPRSHISNIIRDTNSPSAILPDRTWSILIVIENAIHITKDVGPYEKLEEMYEDLKRRVQGTMQASTDKNNDSNAMLGADQLADLQLQVEGDRASIVQICYILHLREPGHTRLSRLPHITGLHDIVLAEMLRLKPDAHLFNPLSYQEADTWLDSARKYTRAADCNLRVAYQRAGTLLGMVPTTPGYEQQLSSAWAASDEAYRHCDNLHTLITDLVTIYQTRSSQDINGETNRLETAK